MLDLKNQQYSVTDLKFTSQAQANNLPFDKANIVLSGDINANMMKQLISIKELALEATVIKDQQVLETTLSAEISSNLANLQSTLKEVALSAHITDPTLPGDKP